MNYQEFRHYSVVHDCRVSRLSAYDANGDEHFVVVPAEPSGAELRAKRERALDALVASITTGGRPGEVTWQ